MVTVMVIKRQDVAASQFRTWPERAVPAPATIRVDITGTCAMTDPDASRRRFAVVEPRSAIVTVALLGAGLLALTGVMVAHAGGLADTLPWSTPWPLPSWMQAILPWALAGCTALCFVGLCTLYGRRSVALEDGILVIRAGLNTRRVPAMAIELERARIIDLDAVSELQPSRMTLGSSLPGYRAGWFRSRQWGKGFYLLTERRRVLWLPERDGPHLLLSLQHPQALLAALNALVPRRRADWP